MSGKKLPFLLLLVPLCAVLGACKTVPRVEVRLPPSSLYVPDCTQGLKERAGEVFNQGAHLTYTLDLIAALRACQSDREAIEAWAKEQAG